MEPIKLHPENNRYFSFRGKPTVLITSAEHYGAVINPDFDFIRYLNELQAKGLNKTRIFTGQFIERADDIPSPGAHNTLCPADGRFLAPWARSAVPGYARGGNKFDLDVWDRRYFDRLAEFVTEAGKRDIVVEVCLFCNIYKDSQWDDCPMKSDNNVNGVGTVEAARVLTTDNGNLLACQKRMVRKFVTELKDFDNVYYEIVNEPYHDYGATESFENHIIATIASTEAAFPCRHLIAVNVANFWSTVTKPNPNVSIYNFHYAYPPDAIAMNESLNKAIAYDESGFQGTADLPYRTGAWDFIVAGGAVFDHLDFSFAVSCEEGTLAVAPDAPGGGGEAIRRQMSILKRFIDGFDFVRMAPDDGVIAGKIPDGVTVRALAERGEQYAIYVNGNALDRISLNLSVGSYTVQWVDTKTGAYPKEQTIKHSGGNFVLEVPSYTDDIALSVKRRRELSSDSNP